MAVLLLGDQPSAEDVVQDAFMGLYKAVPRLRDQGRALPYLYSAVVNGARSVLRARKTRGPAAGPARTASVVRGVGRHGG